MVLLELHRVRAGYGRSVIVRDVDLTIPAGSTVALLGHNGAGKTTLLKLIAGLLPAMSGDITFQCEPITCWPAHLRSRAGICLIPEGRGVFRRLTVRENLAVHAGKGRGADAVDRAAEVFPVLAERLDQQAGTMSGGQQQMLALARAFLTDAPLILGDELSMGLAPVIVDQIFDALAALRRQGRSLLLVEQYVERAVALADYVYILHKGGVVFAGEPAECSSGTVFARYLEGAAS